MTDAEFDADVFFPIKEKGKKWFSQLTFFTRLMKDDTLQDDKKRKNLLIKTAAEICFRKSLKLQKCLRIVGYSFYVEESGNSFYVRSQCRQSGCMEFWENFFECNVNIIQVLSLENGLKAFNPITEHHKMFFLRTDIPKKKNGIITPYRFWQSLDSRISCR